jgi:hypothetical protein
MAASCGLYYFKKMVEVFLFQPQLARRQCRNEGFLLKIIICTDGWLSSIQGFEADLPSSSVLSV